jgi:DNA processing protein
VDPSLRSSLLLNLALRGAPLRRSPPPDGVVLRGGREALLAAGLDAAAADRLLAARASGADVAEVTRAAAIGARIVRPEAAGERGESGFEALEGHPYLPRLVYVQGRTPLPPSPRVAIVGARDASRAACDFARRLGFAAARRGIAVVSGLARGVDAAAHRGLLEGGGCGVAVLGCGLDVVYPFDTRDVRDALLESGAVVTTYPLGTPPLPHHFPTRNRLLAALADAVVVVAARLRSGSMSTARAALDAGCDVLAVPGAPDDPLAEGTLALLRDGASLVASEADLVDYLLGAGAYDLGRGDPRHEIRDPVLRSLAGRAKSPDELAIELERPLPEILARLIELEVEGRLTREPGGTFRRCDRDGGGERGFSHFDLKT